ncbi:hypothetical protein P3T39_002632 [Kitasatospora sp. GP82]|nr:hypothetical protein [Kitasatospora sp. GP82]
MTADHGCEPSVLLDRVVAALASRHDTPSMRL